MKIKLLFYPFKAFESKDLYEQRLNKILIKRGLLRLEKINFILFFENLLLNPIVKNLLILAKHMNSLG